MKTRTLLQQKIKDADLQTAIPYTIDKLVDYSSEPVAATAVLKTITGRVTAMAFNSGVGFEERTISFDTFIQVIDGTLSVIIAKETILSLNTGEGIVLPAHRPHAIKPGGKFKIIMTILKGGYE